MRQDRRDARLGELLDLAVRDLRPDPSPDRAMDRGSARRIGRVVGAIAAVTVFVGGAFWAAGVVGEAEPPPSAGPIVTFASPDAPWSLDYPSGWSHRTSLFAAPDLIVNTLRTTVANATLPDGTGRYGPNSSGNAELTSALGDAGAVVIVQRQWGGALSPPEVEPGGPGRFVEDAQSPGWTFRTRTRCDGTLCFEVIEWLGPEASGEDRAAAAAIADSVRLADVDRWTETDGQLTTLHDENHGFTVTYPVGWLPSDEPINTWVSSPFEILALATYPLRPGGEAVADFQLPSNAVDDLAPNDTFIWVNESGSVSSFADRPERFEPSEPCGGENWDHLCPEPSGDTPRLSIPGMRAWWFGFHDAGRGFYVFVGMGAEAFADPGRVQQAWDVLDSLRFLPR